MSRISNVESQDYGLEQGVKYNSLQHKVIGMRNDVNLNLLEQTSSPSLGSLIEGMENRTVQTENKEVTQHMKDLEHKFNAKLAEYTELYRTYLSQLTSSDELIQKWKGKNVYNNGSFNYVNKYGYTRSFTTDSWDNKSADCNRTVPTEETQQAYDKLQHGASMGVGEPCGLEGTNIRNVGNDKLYWLSPKGVLHHYPDQETWDATMTNGGCPSGQTDLPNSVVSTMQIGTPMNSVSKCDTLHQNSALYSRITDLNEELIKISDEMYNTIHSLNVKDEKVDAQLVQVREELRQRIQELNSEREKLLKEKQSINTLTGEFNDTSIQVTREYTHYLAWLIGAITLGAFAVKYVVKS
jgi:hypothetical protein